MINEAKYLIVIEIGLSSNCKTWRAIVVVVVIETGRACGEADQRGVWSAAQVPSRRRSGQTLWTEERGGGEERDHDGKDRGDGKPNHVPHKHHQVYRKGDERSGYPVPPGKLLHVVDCKRFILPSGRYEIFLLPIINTVYKTMAFLVRYFYSFLELQGNHKEVCRPSGCSFSLSQHSSNSESHITDIQLSIIHQVIFSHYVQNLAATPGTTDDIGVFGWRSQTFRLFKIQRLGEDEEYHPV